MPDYTWIEFTIQSSHRAVFTAAHGDPWETTDDNGNGTEQLFIDETDKIDVSAWFVPGIPFIARHGSCPGSFSSHLLCSDGERSAEIRCTDDGEAFVPIGRYHPLNAPVPIDPEIADILAIYRNAVSLVENILPTDPWSGIQTASLPPYDPDRWRTTDGFEDQDRTNRIRADEARAMVDDLYLKDPENLQDVITNLLHLCHAEGHDPSQILNAARANFLAEAGPIPSEIGH